MSNVYKLPDGKRPYREATSWLTRLDRGLSGQEEQELRTWLQESVDNPTMFMEVAKTWDKMTALSRLSDLFPPSANRRARWPGLAVAASTLLVIGAAFWMFVSLNGISSLDELTEQVVMDNEPVYETAVGEQSTVVLPDGSQVVLNTNSRLRVRYTPYHRVLTLLRGEVHVDVAADPTRPLSVVVGRNIVQAVGTAFGVEITKDQEIELVVTEGKVLVGVHRSQTNGLPAPTTPVLPKSSLTVAQGEELILGAPNAKVTAVSPEELEVKLSWREGNLVFRGEPLEVAMEEVERYTTVQFVFMNEALKRESIAGRFKAGDVDGLLAALRENFDVAYERTDDGRILLSTL